MYWKKLWLAILGMWFWIGLCGQQTKESSVFESKRFSNVPIEEMLDWIDKTGLYKVVYSPSTTKGMVVSGVLSKGNIQEQLVSIVEGSNLFIKVLDDKRMIVGDQVVQQLVQESSPPKKVKLTGRVIDFESKEVLIGATIICSGLTLGTTTDEAGYFYLEVDPDQMPTALSVSYVGYLPQDSSVALRKKSSLQ